MCGSYWVAELVGRGSVEREIAFATVLLLVLGSPAVDGFSVVVLHFRAVSGLLIEFEVVSCWLIRGCLRLAVGRLVG